MKWIDNELKRETFVNNGRGFEKFYDMGIKFLNKHAPLKEKYKRGDQIPFCYKRSFYVNYEKTET